MSRIERLLPAACLVAAAALLVSEFLTAFDLVTAGGLTVASQDNLDRHQLALALLAGFSVVALLVAVGAGSRPAAIAVAVAGIASLLVFLISDLPHSGDLGTINSDRGSVQASAEPRAGFWLEAAGALALAACGLALATLTPEQLRSLRPGRRSRGQRGGDEARSPGLGTKSR